MSMDVQVWLQGVQSLRCMPRNDTAESYGGSIFSFARTPTLPSIVASPVNTPTKNESESHFPQVLPAFAVTCFILGVLSFETGSHEVDQAGLGLPTIPPVWGSQTAPPCPVRASVLMSVLLQLRVGTGTRGRQA